MTTATKNSLLWTDLLQQISSSANNPVYVYNQMVDSIARCEQACGKLLACQRDMLTSLLDVSSGEPTFKEGSQWLTWHDEHRLPVSALSSLLNLTYSQLSVLIGQLIRTDRLGDEGFSLHALLEGRKNIHMAAYRWTVARLQFLLALLPAHLAASPRFASNAEQHSYRRNTLLDLEQAAELLALTDRLVHTTALYHIGRQSRSQTTGMDAVKGELASHLAKLERGWKARGDRQSLYTGLIIQKISELQKLCSPASPEASFGNQAAEGKLPAPWLQERGGKSNKRPSKKRRK